MKKIKYIDLFAGIGGFRYGFESACKEQVCMGDVKLMCHVPLKPIGRLKAIVDV